MRVNKRPLRKNGSCRRWAAMPLAVAGLALLAASCGGGGGSSMVAQVAGVLALLLGEGFGQKPDDRTRIIIVDIGGVKTGLVVSSVREVLNLARKDIAPPPEAIGSGIGKVDAGKRMIVLLDVEKILSRQEQAQLSEIRA